MKILLVEPYYEGSHKEWADSLIRFSGHEVELLSLPGIHWKWRMHGAAITMAEKFLDLDFLPELILCTDMMDVALFISLIHDKIHDVPVITYFHENQFEYPFSSRDTDRTSNRDNHYSFINYTSALVSDRVFFNSEFNRSSFFAGSKNLLDSMPDYKNSDSVGIISSKSEILPLGIDLSNYPENSSTEKENRATILWNHRWEEDKNPKTFFDALAELRSRGIEFKLILLGKSFKGSPEIFKKAQEEFKHCIIKSGFLDRNEYIECLHKADIIPLTSKHDFFGMSLIEAMACNVIPLLPERLAYPEHIPEEYHKTFFYKEDQFVDRLQRMIMNVKVLRNQNVRKFILKYDWKDVIKLYDTAFEKALI